MMSNAGSMRPLSIIVAVDEVGGFGKDGIIPWVNEPFAKEDFKHFQTTTKGGICIMGKNTYVDMKEMADSRGRDITKAILPNRESYVISSTLKDDEVIGATRAVGIRNIMDSLKQLDDREVFILGGDKLFVEALTWTNKIYMTIVKEQYDCDRFFQLSYINDHFKLNKGRQSNKLEFIEYDRIK